jgi:hypothetical protein
LILWNWIGLLNVALTRWGEIGIQLLDEINVSTWHDGIFNVSRVMAGCASVLCSDVFPETCWTSILLDQDGTVQVVLPSVGVHVSGLRRSCIMLCVSEFCWW